MSTEEKIKIMQAYLEGERIEKCYRGSSAWEGVTIPDWSWGEYDYRVSLRKPSINWNHVHPKFNYLAKNMHGFCYLFREEPEIFREDWVSNNTYGIYAGTHSSLDPGHGNWKESLVGRPL